MDSPPDTDRIARALQGDSDALEALLREVEPELRTSLDIQPLWNRSFDIEDVLQVTYIEAFLRIQSLEQNTLTGFKSWLRRIADHNMKDAVRALNRNKRPDARKRVTQGPAGESSRTLLNAIIGGKQRTAGSALSEREEIVRLHEAIRKLPRTYRKVVEEVELAERTVAEVAEEMSKSSGAVHMIRSRARDRLQELLQSSQ
jgi:RNA polymerase sigma-70 factor (ECF subfamily)